MIEKINYFLEHGMDVHSSVNAGGHISVSIFNSKHNIVASADYFDHSKYGHGTLDLSIRDSYGRETMRLTDSNYPVNRPFDAIMDDILDMFIRKLPVTQPTVEPEVNWEPLPNLHGIPTFDEFCDI